MNWTKQKPTKEGLYLYRDGDRAVLMRVEYYQDLQSGIGRHLLADPQLPYKWTSKPAFGLKELNGEWSKWEEGK